MSHYRTDSEFYAYQGNVVDGVTGHLVEFSIPADELAPVVVLKIIYEEKYALGSHDMADVRSDNDIHNLQIAKREYTLVFNSFVSSNVKNNKKISDFLKNEWGVHIDSTVRVATEVCSTFPVGSKVDTNTPSHVKIEFKDSGHSSKADRGVCQSWVFVVELDKDGHEILPVSDDDYRYSCDSNTDKIDLKCKLVDGGKKMLVKLCYKNNVGKGEYGPKLTVTIPRD
ncbi:MAG: hypothetical protein WCL14_09745 [Bacteroidota bacterium]